jgi:hypothetical protein
MLLQAVAGVHSDADPVDWEDSWMSGDRNEDEAWCSSSDCQFYLGKYHAQTVWRG